MSAENEVKKLGRVEYIEPNNLFVHSTGNKIKNGIPQPYENYSFSVNLRVINGNRYDCGLPSDGEDIANRVIEYSSDNGTISFMDGTSVDGGQGYLTTNFTDISMNNPETNTRECLGIESINVKFDSWYFPMVDITFVDVRGASLMQPAEYEYYNNGGGSQGKNEAVKSNSNFFKAFFSFPYPLFKLSIKGFYGKEVTYDLSLLKCNIEFNSQNGNFEIHSSFIGYMYGMYSDIPFSFLYVAPYIDLYGKNTWDEKIKNGDFWYLGSDERPSGHEMYTFPELFTAVKNADIMAKKESVHSPEGEQQIEIEKLHEKLAKHVLPEFPVTKQTGYWRSWSPTDTEENSDGFFFIAMENSPKENRNIFESFMRFSTELNEYNELAKGTENYKENTVNTKEIFQDVYLDAKELEKKGKAKAEAKEETYSSRFTDEQIEKMLDGRVVSLVFKKEGSDTKNAVLKFDREQSQMTSGSGTSIDDYQKLIDELIRRFDKNEPTTPMLRYDSQKIWTIRAFKIDDIHYRDKIVDAVNKEASEVNRLVEELDAFRDQRIIDAVGFEPTMRNIYNMFFAHVDTFMSCFYNTLDKIRNKIQSGDESRSYKKLCGKDIQVDVNENTLRDSSPSGNGGKLPPFTMFYKEEPVKDSKDKEIVMQWPGSLPGGKDLDEVQLVEAIINATALSRRRYETVQSRYNTIDKEGNLVPTNYYDLIDNEHNPYVDVLDAANLQKPVHELAKVFLLRCYFSLLGGSYVSSDNGSKDGTSTMTQNMTEKAKLIAKLEVGNVVRAFKIKGYSPKDSFITELHTIADDGSNLLNEFMKDSHPMFRTNGAGDIEYQWIKYPGTENKPGLTAKFYPVGTFEPSVLTNAVNGANIGKNNGKFVQINNSGTTVNSLTCRIFDSGRKIDSVLNKHASGEFVSAAKLFPNYQKLPASLNEITFDKKAFENVQNFRLGDLYKRNGNTSTFESMPSLPSYRKSTGGETNIFMDPLYYCQKTPEARAYLFLLGIPLSEDKKLLLPKKVENGDYPVFLLLREGAVYWRNTYFNFMEDRYAYEDPINYKYSVNNVRVDVESDVENNDPCLGKKYIYTNSGKLPENVSSARRDMLIRFFLRWATGSEEYTMPDSSVVGELPDEIRNETSIPSVSLDFQTIERNFALQKTTSANGGSVMSNLSDIPDAVTLALTLERAGNFDNASTLREVYEIGQDDKLGKLNGQKIRTGVFIKTSNTENKFLKKFKDFFTSFASVIDFSLLDNPNETYTVPRNAINDAMAAFIGGIKEEYKVSAEDLKAKDGVTALGKPEEEFNKPEFFRDEGFKLACYMALKNLYDRWLCSRRRESWVFSCVPERMVNNGVRSDFTRFTYMNEFYQEIGMKIRPNLTDFITTASKLGGFTEESDASDLESRSLLKLLSITAELAGCSLLTLPTMLGLSRTYTGEGNEQNSIADVFRAFPYNEAVRSNSVEPSFVVLYTNQKSTKLDTENESGTDAFKDDGFDLANTWGEIVEQPMFADNDENGLVVPCFGVTFAKQSQSYFKNIRLSMEDHQVTEYSLRNQLMISYANNRGPRESAIIGQDLYSVYANYSYTCSVEMLGDAQITPLMYFQLNNIAMWKGAYLITNVQHSINAQGMVTTFTGTRQARPSVPFKGDKISNAANKSAGQTQYSGENGEEPGTSVEAENTSQKPLDKINVDDINGAVIYLERQTISEMDDERWINGILSVRVFYPGNVTETYDNISKTKEATYGLTGRIEYFVPQDNQTIFSAPAGIYTSVVATGDMFKHIEITDSRLHGRVCEIIEGIKNYSDYETDGFLDITLGGATPIMLFGTSSEFDKDEIHGTYMELFNFIQRVKRSNKYLNCYIKDSNNLEDNVIEG